MKMRHVGGWISELQRTNSCYIASHSPSFWLEVYCGYPITVLPLYILGVWEHITCLFSLQAFRMRNYTELYPKNCTGGTSSLPGIDLCQDLEFMLMLKWN